MLFLGSFKHARSLPLENNRIGGKPFTSELFRFTGTRRNVGQDLPSNQ
jgi:hypothetical protein